MKLPRLNNLMIPESTPRTTKSRKQAVKEMCSIYMGGVQIIDFYKLQGEHEHDYDSMVQTFMSRWT